MFNKIFTTEDKVTLKEAMNVLIEKEQDEFDHTELLKKLEDL